MRGRTRKHRGERGQTAVLIIGFFLVAVVLVVVVVDEVVDVDGTVSPDSSVVGVLGSSGMRTP